jgi:hypothetical protein
MIDLSPAAQAVLNAYRSRWDFDLAAALRALADQVVQEEPSPGLMRGPDLERLCQRQHTRAEILAIAAELEGADD